MPILAISGSSILLRFVLAIVLLLVGFQLTVWFTLGLAFVLYDEKSKADKPARRIRAFILFSFSSLVGIAMLGFGIFLFGQGIWQGWKLMQGGH
jgi:hypothetical protein